MAGNRPMEDQHNLFDTDYFLRLFGSSQEDIQAIPTKNSPFHLSETTPSELVIETQDLRSYLAYLCIQYRSWSTLPK